MSGLPEGWAGSTVGELWELKYGKSLPEKARVAGDFMAYGSNGVVGSHTQALTSGPTIIIGRKGSIGELHFSSRPCFPIDTTYFIDDFSGCDEAFVTWLLHSLPLKTLNRATAIPGLNRDDAYALDIALPPLAEQRRIVAKLDALTARTARARDDLDRIPALAARYKQAVLDAAYGGHLSDQPLGQLAVADVISRLDQGWSPKCESEAAGEGEWGVIKTTAIQGIWFDELANKRLPSHLEARPAIEIVAGDVLITRAGPRSRVGVTCVVRQTRDRLMLCDKAYRLRVKPGVMNAEFLALMLNSPQALRAIEEMKTGISDSGLNLTQGKLLALSLPVPPVDEQKRLVAKIDRAFTEIDRLTAEAAAARRLLDRLDQAILAKAFRGELVPQDPADEPAGVLLERIRAERAAAPKPKRGRRKAAA